MPAATPALDPLTAALCAADPSDKCGRVAALDGDAPWPELTAAVDRDHPGIPGRPERPQLVDPKQVPRRGLGTQDGRAAMVHAIAHIEFNAINLALDAAWRFREMPAQYYRDWISVAQDEARHFAMLRARLQELGSDYGAFAAHDGLWEAAEKTRDDPLERMALVPRVLEARGLDVTPGMIHRLEETGDAATAAVLRVILAEEVRHVAIGTRWFHHLCAQRGVEPQATFLELVRRHRANVRAPLNREARIAAGFDAAELDALVAKI
jgi:uncharacterized ferritin-like protein (DUF455 family)